MNIFWMLVWGFIIITVVTLFSQLKSLSVISISFLSVSYQFPISSLSVALGALTPARGVRLLLVE